MADTDVTVCDVVDDITAELEAVGWANMSLIPLVEGGMDAVHRLGTAVRQAPALSAVEHAEVLKLLVFIFSNLGGGLNPEETAARIIARWRAHA